MRISLSLGTKVSLIISVFVSLLLGLVIFFIATRLSSALNEIAKSDNQQIVDARADQLGEFIVRLASEMKQASARSDLRDEDPKKVFEDLKAVAPLVSKEVNLTFFAWPNGDYVTSQGSKGNVNDRDYFNAIKNGKDFFISEATTAKSTGLSILMFAAPVKDGQGKLKGVFALQIVLDKLSEVATHMKAGRTGYGWICDNKGLIIGHPNKDINMKLNISEADEKAGYKGLSALAKKMLSTDVGVGEYSNGKGVAYTTYYATVPNSPGWKLGLTLPSDEVHEALDQLIFVLLIVLAAAVVAAVLVSILISRSIVKPLEHVVTSVGRLSKGDLAAKESDAAKAAALTKRRDEIGEVVRSVEALGSALEQVVVDIRSAADQVANGSSQLSSSSQSFSEGANEQASSIEELSSSVEELASTIKQNADNTTQADSLARRVAANAEESGKAVGETVSSMKEIAARISIIEEIARQTNLLALNAAIEAARAGEAGKGFAVVASEVRKLAERSQKAAAEINALSKRSVDVAGVAGKSLEALVPDIRKAAELIQEITAASKEQSGGADQIAKGVEQMDQVVQRNASSSEELAATAEELSAQARLLTETVGFFKTAAKAGTVRAAAAKPVAKPKALEVRPKPALPPAERKVKPAPEKKAPLGPPAEKTGGTGRGITLIKDAPTLDDSDFEDL